VINLVYVFEVEFVLVCSCFLLFVALFGFDVLGFLFAFSLAEMTYVFLAHITTLRIVEDCSALYAKTYPGEVHNAIAHLLQQLHSVGLKCLM
jgi:hypothetical protein